MNVRRYDRVKRAIDIAAAASGLLLTAPLQVGIAVLIRLRLGRPVLFRQLRPGKNGRLFTLVKFRTMHNLDPSAGLVTDAERLTRLGATLRSTSLDELPTLWNVLRGEMSLVGPRPLLPVYLSRYTDRQARRHEVRPGITGLAQTRGRNELAWPKRLELDVEYVDTRSLGLDLHILLQTFRTVTARTGISDGSTPTMTPFTNDQDGG